MRRVLMQAALANETRSVHFLRSENLKQWVVMVAPCDIELQGAISYAIGFQMWSYPEGVQDTMPAKDVATAILERMGEYEDR